MKHTLLVLFLAISGLVFAQNDTIVKQDLAKNAEYFSKGISEKYNENIPLAIYNFEQALKFYNDDDASMYELAELYQSEGRNTEALAMLNHAVTLQPDNKWYQIRLAKFSALNGDYQTFIKIYDKLLEDEPENLDYLEAYISILLSVGEYNKVLEKLNILEDQAGKNEMIYLQKIQIYDEQGKKDEAITEMEKLVEYMPDNTQYLAMLAEAYRKTKRDQDAYHIYLKIKQLDPDNKYINVSLMDYYLSVDNKDKAFEEFIEVIKNPNLDYDTKVQLYNFVLQDNKFNFKTERELNEKMEIIANAFIQTHSDKPVGYYAKGSTYQAKGNYLKAKDLYVMCIAKGGSDNMVYYNLLNCFDKLKYYEEQVIYSEKALELYPAIPIFYVYNGIGYYNIKNYEGCIKSFEKARKFTTESNLLLILDSFIGDSYHNLKNNEKAYEAYDRILRYKPDEISVLNNYAYYLSLDNKDLERALEMSEKTIKAEPKNATYLDTYAWVLYKLGRYKEAKKYIDKALKYEKHPNGANYEHLGDILYKLGDTKNAVKNWKKAQNVGSEVSEFLDKKIKDEKLYE